MKYNFVTNTQDVSINKSIVVAVKAMRVCNNAVEAIKLLRQTAVLGLKEAKDLSDFIHETFDFNEAGSLIHKETIPVVRFLGTYES